MNSIRRNLFTPKSVYDIIYDSMIPSHDPIGTNDQKTQIDDMRRAYAKLETEVIELRRQIRDLTRDAIHKIDRAKAEAILKSLT